LIKSFRELDVYRKAFEISLLVHHKSLEFPSHERYALADQIRRASKSICANLAEGFAKQKTSKAEFCRFIMIAFGSSNEMLVWIDYCKQLGYISSEVADGWEKEYTDIGKMLQSLHNKTLNTQVLKSSSSQVL
jgi:four helix bundle protein